MPATRTQSSADTITVVTSEGAESFHATVWRRLVDAWPAWSDPPIAAFSADLGYPTDTLPRTAVIIDAREGIDRQAVSAMDLARHAGIPVIAMIADDAQREALDDGAEVFAFDNDTDPGEMACVLATLLRRQKLVVSLSGELGMMQKFHTGVRGEIDKINEEMQLAATMQRDFLPSELPVIDGYDAAALYRPCGCVSGDIYDLRELHDGTYFMLIADAVGHGVPAALMTMVIAKSVSHTIQRAERKGLRLDPSTVLDELNKDLAGRGLDASRFATAVCGVLDTQTNTMSMASAGHPHPLLIRTDGEIVRVMCEGCLLGVFEEAEYEACDVTLAPGDALLVYSDGFEVAFPTCDQGTGSPNTHYLERFSMIPARAEAGTLDEALRTLSLELDAHRGSLHQQDDLTVVGLARSRGA